IEVAPQKAIPKLARLTRERRFCGDPEGPDIVVHFQFRRNFDESDRPLAPRASRFNAQGRPAFIMGAGILIGLEITPTLVKPESLWTIFPKVGISQRRRI